MKRYMNWKLLVICLLMAALGLTFGLLSDAGDGPPSLSRQSSQHTKETQAQREAAERVKHAKDESVGVLPEGVTRRADWATATDEERREMVKESKSPHHLDQGMEWGYFDADGNWVSVSDPGVLASDGYFYDAQGRRIVARKAGASASASDASRDGSGDESADQKYDAIYVVVRIGKNPLEGATVNLSSGENTLFSQTTNAEGLAKFTPLDGEAIREVTFSLATPNYKAEPVTRTLAPGEGTKVELLAEPDWTISGVVLDEQEVPLAGVRVDLTNDFGTSLGDFRTGVDGAFRFTNLEELFYELAIHRADFQSEFVHRHTLPGYDLRIILKRAVYVSGQIKDQDGNPIEHVRVESRHEPELQEAFVATTFSDAEGKYRVDAVAGAERMKMIFARAGYTSKTEYPVMADTTGLDVVLNETDEATVSGILQFVDGTYPKSSVTEIGNRSNTNTYQNGQPHRFEVSFKPKDGESSTLLIYSTEFKMQEIEIGAVAVGETKDLGTIVVEPGAMIRGIVLNDETGEPVIGATIVSSLDHYTTLATSGTDGRFEFSAESLGIPENSKPSLSAFKEGYNSSSSGSLRFPQQELYEIRISKNEGGSAFVRYVADGTDIPIVGLTIFPDGFSDNMVQTDSKGEALVSTPFNFGSYGISLAHSSDPPFYVASSNRSITFYDTEEDARENPHVIRIEKGALFSTSMLGDKAKPLENVYVYLKRESQSQFSSSGFYQVRLDEDTNAEVDYREQIVLLGTYDVSCEELRLFPRKFEMLESKAYAYEIKPVATIKVTGTIRDGNGQPHANRGFYVYRSKGSGVFETGFTDSQGRYEIENLWPGDFHLAIAKDNAEQAAQYFKKITVTSGKQEQSHDISLPAASVTISGVVKYADGTPVSGATVSMTDRSVTLARGVLAGYVRTDANGKFTAKHIEEFANIDIRVGGYPDEAETRLTFKSITTGGSNTVNAVEIIVERKGASGTVGYQAGADVVFEPQDVTAIATDSQGRKVGNFFSGQFVDLAPGTYTYQFYAAGYLATPVTITVSESLQVNISGKATWSYDPDWPSPEG